MENRIATHRSDRPGAAFIAFVVILGITAAWWALALWPAGAVEPEWLARTRAACFGSQRGGLPDAGGWVLLIGEPIGMIALLAVIWGRSLRHDMRWIFGHRLWRAVAVGVAVLAAGSLAAVTTRVARAAGFVRGAPATDRGVSVSVDLETPELALVDQYGARTSMADFRGSSVLLTFAFGHCTTVCPAVVQRLKSARQAANRPDVRLVVITLDPWRDTPERLETIARQWGLEQRDRLLSGTVPEVTRALADLGVGGRRSETTGDVDHAATVLAIDARGRIVRRSEGGREAWDGVSQFLRAR